jgi:tRNA threonylcarbamoyl adenosine modification protein (Sua5/YciO/YrdC/YwlC family)
MTNMAEFIKLYNKDTDLRQIRRVVECLQKGGIIIYPTDTIYGLGCDIHNPKAIEKICQLKGIKTNKSNFSIICHDLSHIADYARVSTPAFKLMKKALPGPFTFLLDISSRIPRTLNPSKKTIGIRIPDNNIARLLVQELGNPIITTSLKDDDEILEYPTDPELIFEKYQTQVDIVIDGGYGGNEPSTIVDATTDDFEVIRQGLGELEDFL